MINALTMFDSHILYGGYMAAFINTLGDLFRRDQKSSEGTAPESNNATPPPIQSGISNDLFKLFQDNVISRPLLIAQGQNIDDYSNQRTDQITVDCLAHISSNLRNIEVRIVKRDFRYALKAAEKQIAKEFPSITIDNINDLAKISREVISNQNKLKNKNLTLKETFRQRNIFLMISAPLLIVALILGALACVFANPLALIIAGAILLATGTALGVSAFTRHLQYKKNINNMAKINAIMNHTVSQALKGSSL